MDTQLTAHMLPESASLLEALERLNALPGRPYMTLMVLDSAGVLRGTLTDGDIRRALLRGQGLESNVMAAVCSHPLSINAGMNADEVLEIMHRAGDKGITLLPETDERGILTGIVNLAKTPTRLPLRAILMAGGKGERLRPLTLETPKPLLKIEGKAIIDYNMDMLAAAGIKDVTVCTRYLAEQLESHFAKPVNGIKVKCVRETDAMGTIGAAALTDVMTAPADENTLVMNSDLLTTIDLEEMYLHHRHSKADITIATVPYQVSVPYAILDYSDESDPSRVTAIKEKPGFSYYANAGIYIFRNKVLQTLPTSGRTDATDLIEQSIAKGRNVVHYTIKGVWIDVGSPTEFRQAAELMRHHHTLAQSLLR